MMKNLSKTKLKMGKLLVCGLMVAFVFQLSSLSLVQATSETIPRTTTNDGSLYDSVSINNGENVTFVSVDTDVPVLISTEDGPMILEDTINNQEDIQTMLPDDATPYNPEDQQIGGRELISAPETQPVVTAGYAGIGVLLGIVAIAAVVLVAQHSRKIEK